MVAQLTSTVNQNIHWKAGLLDLWRNTSCATRAPGQPPKIAMACSEFSGVRQVLSRAAALSRA